MRARLAACVGLIQTSISCRRKVVLSENIGQRLTTSTTGLSSHLTTLCRVSSLLCGMYLYEGEELRQPRDETTGPDAQMPDAILRVRDNLL